MLAPRRLKSDLPGIAAGREPSWSGTGAFHPLRAARETAVPLAFPPGAALTVFSVPEVLSALAGSVKSELIQALD
jgi:hypothetical protein